MATLFNLKGQLDADPHLEAVRIAPLPGSIASAAISLENGFYVVSDGDQQESWSNWDNAVETVGEQWAGAGDWTVRART